jgi:hypothetical protein
MKCHEQHPSPLRFSGNDEYEMIKYVGCLFGEFATGGDRASCVGGERRKK